MFCPKCGATLPDSAGFCGACGTALQQPAGPASATPAVGIAGGASTIGRAGGMGSLGVFGIAKWVGIVVLLVCMFMPWFQVSFDSLIDSMNREMSQYSYSSGYVIPKLGGLGVSVLSIGDSLNQVGQLSDWLQQASAATGQSSMGSSEAALMASLQSAGGAALPYRLFGLLWIAGIVIVAAGAGQALMGKRGGKLLLAGTVICAVTAIIALILAASMSSQVSNAIMQVSGMMGSSYRSALAQMGGNLFGFTAAPIVAIVAAAVAFAGSFMESRQ